MLKRPGAGVIKRKFPAGHPLYIYTHIRSTTPNGRGRRGSGSEPCDFFAEGPNLDALVSSRAEHIVRVLHQCV
jgi:hypothetical protein